MLTLVILVHVVIAAPIPHVVKPQDLRKEASKRELRSWSERLGRIGIEIEPSALGEQVMRATGRIGGVHRALKAPYVPIRRFTGTNQGWALFAVPAANPPRFEIRVRREGSTVPETLFLHLDPEHDWWRDRLVYRRVRGLWNSAGHGKRPSGTYRRFARFIAQQVLDEMPDVSVVTVRQLVAPTPLPGEAGRADARPRFRITVKRDG